MIARTLIAAMLLAASVAAQTTVTISGRVIDPAGRPVPRATVTAIDPVTGSAIVPGVSPDGGGAFRITLPPSVFTLIAGPHLPPLVATQLRVDARNGNVDDIVLRLTAHTPVVPNDPPRASLIEVSVPDANGDATVRGAAGAVAPGAFLVLVTLDSGHAVTSRAADDGSFSASIFAPAGSSILIKSDPFGFASRHPGNVFPSINPPFSLMAGTIVRVADPGPAQSGVPFGRTGRLSTSAGPGGALSQLPRWTFEGTIESTSVPAGGTVRVNGTFRIRSPSLSAATTSPLRLSASLRLDKLAAADGSGAQPHNTFSSTLLTPTDLPIERERNGRSGSGLDQTLVREIQQLANERAEVPIAFALTLPPDVPSGYYVPLLSFAIDGLPPEPTADRVVVVIERSGKRGFNATYLPIIRVGVPASPRLPAVLFADRVSDGARGVRARENARRFALSPRIRMDDGMVVPRVDAAGAPIRYRLEPFLPTIALIVAGQPNLPTIPFRFPSGGLTVKIEAPDGSVRTIGPAPFLQPLMQSRGLTDSALRDVSGGFFSLVFTLITECYQLTTLDPRFEVEFTHDGRHTITLDGSVDDLWGNRWSVGGTYDVHVGRALSIQPAVIPGTPFEVGDVFDPAVTIAPPLPADVEVRIRFAPDSDVTRMIERVIRGRANRFGQFAPADRVLFQQPGEYRVDVLATSGESTGLRTWGNVVAPRDTPIVAHGRRGMVNTAVLGSQWFFRTQTPFPTLPHVSHPNPPFHSGDVFWAQKSDTAFVLFTFQEQGSAVTDLLRMRRRESGVGLRDPGTFEDRVPLGELPLFSSSADGTEPHIDPSRVDLWGYSYRFVERPSISVREFVAEDGVALGYWPFNDPYAGQYGMGADGDLPHDFKFYFGGAVLRGPALSRNLYAAYGSLFVLVPDNDTRGGSRVFPPFQGNGGGPSGGPLFTLKGRDIDLFFHPTSIRPGAIFELNETASFTGYSAPPLSSKVEIVVTSPSGRTRTLRGQANKVGYFQHPGFPWDEEGIWKAKVKITFDGATSAGQLSPQYPTGDVLGSREGEFNVYVVRGDTQPLEVRGTPTSSSAPPFVRPSTGPITFTITPPSGLTNVQLTYTTTMPGFVLEEGTTNALTYTYDARRVASDFPNLDLRGPGGDTITISLLLSGTDASGARKHFARQIVIQGEELQMPEQRPNAAARRRATR